MLILQNGSAIAMRQNTKLIPIALLVLGILVILMALRYLFLWLSKTLKANTKGAHKSLDIALVKSAGQRLGLSKDEINFLIDRCKKTNITDLPLIAATDQCINEHLKKIYEFIAKNEEKLAPADLEVLKLYLFMLLHKIETAKASLSILTNTIAFPSGIPISYINDKGKHNSSSILANTAEGLLLSIPKSAAGELIKPEPLSKIELYVELKGSIAYQVSTRIIRYQKRSDIEEMVISHSNNIQFFQRRKFRRMSANINCKFKAVKKEKNKKNDAQTYTVHGREYLATIINLSVGGCKLKTILPIRSGQLMQIEADLTKDKTDSIIGVVIKSAREASSQWCVLNIRFLKLTKKTRNTIFALLYNYI